MRFLGNYFGVGFDPFTSPEVQATEQKKQEQAAQQKWGQELVSELEKEHAQAKKEREAAEAGLVKPPGPDYGTAVRGGVSTGLQVLTQAEAGRPRLTGGSGPRVTAAGGTYGPGYTAPPTTKPSNGFISRNKWLLIGVGGGAIVLMTMMALILKKRSS